MTLKFHRACLVLLLTTLSHATTYYVSSTGNDTNNGTAQSTPWKTLAKLNTSSFQPGDVILFQRSDTWRETLIPPSSGAAGNVITFGNYGTGALPIITGADLIPSSSWTLEATYYFHSGHPVLPSGVWNNGARLTLVATKAAVTSDSVWWYDSASQRVYVWNSGAGAPGSLEIQIRDYNIDTASNPKSHLLFDGLDLQKARQNFRLYSWSAAAADWTIQNCTLQSEPNPGDISAGIYATGTTGTFDNVTVRNNTLLPWPGTPLTYVNNAYGIYFTGVPGRVPVTNFLIDGNTIGPAGKHAICIWHASIGTVSNNILGGNSESCIDVKDTPYATITRNRCDNDGEYSIVYHASDTVGSTHDGTVSLNHVTRGGQNQGVDHGHGANQIGDIALHATQNTTVAYNWVETSWGAGIYVNDYASVGGGNNNSVLYNVVANNGTGKLDAGISLADVVNAKIFGNTVYSQGYNGNALWLSGGAHTSGSQLANNLLYGTGSGALVNIGNAGQPGLSSDHNLFFNAGSPLQLTWSGSSLDLPAWRTASLQDAHSFNLDPQFVDVAAPDFRLDITSPIIDAGTDLGTTYAAALDPSTTYPWSTLDQSLRGSAWDIGAFAESAVTRYGRGLGASGWATIGAAPAAQQTTLLKASPPALVPNPTECDGAADVSRIIPGDYPATCAGLNSSLSAWAAAADQTWDVSIAAATDFGLCTLNLPFKTNATKCIRFHSSTPNPAGQIACSHGLQDPTVIVPSSTDPGYRNLGCDGTNLSYQNGNTMIAVAPNAAYNDRAKMWRIAFGYTGGGNQSAITCGALDANGRGCHHIKFSDLEVAWDASALGHAAFKYSPIVIKSTSQTTLASAPSHIWFDRNYWHSNIPDNPVTQPAGNGLYAELGLFATFDCAYCGILNTYTDQIGSNSGAESKVFGVVNGPGPQLIDHNWLEGGAINVMYGGNQPNDPSLYTDNVTFTRNRLTKPFAWMQYYATGSFLGLKNSIELKRIKHFRVEGNIVENSNANAQDGQCMGITVRDACNGGSSACDEGYGSTIEDITIKNNVFRHCAQGIQLDGRSGPIGNGAGVSLAGRRWSFYNNLFYDIGNAAVFGPHTPNYIWRPSGTGNTWTSCTATRNSAGTQATIDCTASPQNAVGFKQTGMVTADLAVVSACTDTTFNTPAMPAEGVHSTLAVPTSLQVTYPNVGTPNASATGCTLGSALGNGTGGNALGFPSDMDWIHNTAIGQNSSMACYRPAPWMIGLTVRDNICAVDTGIGLQTNITPGGGQAEGTNSENYLDQPTFEFHHNWFGQRTASSYTEYPGNNASTIKPPNTVWASPIQCATGNASTEGCVGFSGMMSGAGFQLTLPNWYDYALHSTSPYASTGARHSSDNKDLGADLNLVRQAQTPP